jgi:hypothetical protein
MRRALLCGTAMLMLLSGCSSDGGEENGAPSEITGVVIDIDASSLDDVEGFTLRSEGRNYEILIDPDVEYGFPLGHLAEHRSTADPVKVELEEREGELFARSIEDV